MKKFAFHCTWVYLAICALVGVFVGFFGGLVGVVGGDSGMAALGALAFFAVTFLGMLLNFLPVYLIVLVVGCLIIGASSKNNAS